MHEQRVERIYIYITNLAPIGRTANSHQMLIWYPGYGVLPLAIDHQSPRVIHMRGYKNDKIMKLVNTHKQVLPKEYDGELAMLTNKND